MQIIQPRDIELNTSSIDIAELFNNGAVAIARRSIAETIDIQLTVLQDDYEEATLVSSSKQMFSPSRLKSIAKDVFRDRMNELLESTLAAIDCAYIDITPVFALGRNNQLEIKGIADTSYIR